MKGLLIKDLYMVKKYCRSYFLLMAVFIGASFFATGDNLFFVFYPCMISGMIPVTLLGYDERSGWDRYCRTLPVSKGQIVSVKYLIGLGFQVLIILLVGALQLVRVCTGGPMSPGEFLLLMALLFIVSCLSSSICLPFMFKLGVEKGRVAYYVMIGFVCAGSFIASGIFSASLISPMQGPFALLLSCFASAAIYALSWYLSIVFLRKREI